MQWAGALLWSTRLVWLISQGKVHSAIDRYRNEAIRAKGVLDLQLRSTDKQYLMEDGCICVDLMFVPYMRCLEIIMAADLHTAGHKHFTERRERPGVQKVMKQCSDELAAGTQQSD